MSWTTQQFKEQSWSLDDLYSGLDDAAIETSLEELEALLVEMEAFRPKLTPSISAADFTKTIALNEQISQLFYRLYGFGSLSFASDTQDQNAQSYMAKIGQVAAEAQNRTLFFSIWWKELDNENAARLTAASGEFVYWLDAIRLEKPHTLTEDEEKIVNLKNVNGRAAFNKLYDSITNRYVFKLEVDGEEQELTREQLSSNFRSPNPATREAAYQELYRVYGHDAPILGQVYQYIVRDWRSENVDLRNYASPLAVRNRANDIPDEVVDTLLGVMRKNAPMFHRYFALKAKWVGVDKLRRYDLYAPTVTSNKSYAYNDAVHMVLDSFNEFDPRIAKLAHQVFSENHYDSETRTGKRGGAFCSTLGPKLTPWVLQSYQGKVRDVTTMAHELGHAVHSLLANGNSILTQSACLPLAETASTFGEMLIVDKLMAADPDPAVHRDLLFSGMDDAYATIMRQSYFSIFERDAHAAIAEGASVDQLSELYLANLKEQFGDSMDVSDDFKHEWVAIPHFYHVPFYVYAYAFGQLLALALYQQYQNEGDAMIPRYIDFLAAGGSEAPIDLLEKAGFDVYTDEFWQGGFDVIAAQLAKLEAMPITP